MGCCSCYPRIFRPLFFFTGSLDFTFATHKPITVLPLASTVVLFQLYYSVLSSSGIFPSSTSANSESTPLALRQRLTLNRLPFDSALTLLLDVLAVVSTLAAAYLALGASSSIQNSRDLFPAALCVLFLSLFLDGLLVLPSIHAMSELLTLPQDGSSHSADDTLAAVSSATRVLIFFLLKLALLGSLLCSRAPARRESARAALWAAVAEALSGPVPALWTLPWSKSPAAQLKVAWRGGFAGLVRSATSLIACAPPKQTLASLLSLMLLAIFVSSFTTQLALLETTFKAFVVTVRSQVSTLVTLASNPVFSQLGVDPSALSSSLALLSTFLDFFVSALSSTAGTIWVVFAVCLGSIVSSLVGTARDHLRVMATMPPPAGQPPLPFPEFLLEDSSPGHSMRVHVRGEVPSHWESKVPFYLEPWYRLTALCGLGSQPGEPLPSTGITPLAGSGSGTDPGSSDAKKAPAVVWTTPDVSPGVDNSLVPAFSFVFFYVITQVTFGFYVTIVSALGILGLRFLLNNPTLLVVPLVTAALKKLLDTFLHYALTVDGTISRPRWWLLLDPIWGVVSIAGSAPSAILRFALAIVEGVLRSTQMHRPSASGVLASLDPGFASYMAVLRIRYAPLYVKAGCAAGDAPMSQEEDGSACCSDCLCCSCCPCCRRCCSGVANPPQSTAAATTANATAAAAAAAPKQGVVEWGTCATGEEKTASNYAQARVVINPIAAGLPSSSVSAPANPTPPGGGGDSSSSSSGAAAAGGQAGRGSATGSAAALSLPGATSLLALTLLHCQGAACAQQLPPTILPVCTLPLGLPLPLDFSLVCIFPGTASVAGSAAPTDALSLRLAASPGGFPWCTSTLQEASLTPTAGAAPTSPRQRFSLGPLNCTAPPCCLIAECRGGTCQGAAAAVVALDSWQVAAFASASPTPTPSGTPSLSPGASPSATPSPSPPPLSFFPPRQTCTASGNLSLVTGGAAAGAAGAALGGERCQGRSDADVVKVEVRNPMGALFSLTTCAGVQCCGALNAQPQQQLQQGLGAVSFSAEAALTYRGFCDLGDCCFVLQCQQAEGCGALEYHWSVSPPPPLQGGFWALLVLIPLLGLPLVLVRLLLSGGCFAALDRVQCCRPHVRHYAPVGAGGDAPPGAEAGNSGRGQV